MAAGPLLRLCPQADALCGPGCLSTTASFQDRRGDTAHLVKGVRGQGKACSCVSPLHWLQVSLSTLRAATWARGG